MCEAGSPLAFYKHGGGVELGTTKQKKKNMFQLLHRTRLEHNGSWLYNATAPATKSRSRRLFLVII